MKVNLKGRSFLTLLDFSSSEIRYLLDLGHDLKSQKKAGLYNYNLKGKSIVLIFEKNSTRTRCAFEVAAFDEGAHVTYLNHGCFHFGSKESVEDSSKVLARFYDGIEYRGFSQEILEEISKYSKVPVFNGLTNKDHPTQILADLMTIEEHVKKPLTDVKVAFVGDTKNNMVYAWMCGCAKLGMKFVGYGPKSLYPDKEVFKKVEAIAKDNGAMIDISDDILSLNGADIIYTDVWVSMGEENGIEKKVNQLSGYRVTMDVLEATNNSQVKFMHCLPAFHDFKTDFAKRAKDKGIDLREVSDEVFRSDNSIVFDQAENRMHSIKAILVATM